METEDEESKESGGDVPSPVVAPHPCAMPAGPGWMHHHRMGPPGAGPPGFGPPRAPCGAPPLPGVAPAGWSTPGWYGPVPGGGGAAPPSLDEAERARYARGAPLDHEMGDYFVQQDPFRV